MANVDRLRGELSQYYDRKYRPILESMRDWNTENSKLSDDEYRAKRISELESYPDKIKNDLTAMIERWPRKRITTTRFTDEIISGVVEFRTSEALPFVIEVRADSEAEGELTEAQIKSAEARLSKVHLDEAMRKLDANIARKPPGAMREWLERFRKVNELNIRDLQSRTGRVDLSETEYNAVTKRVIERLKGLGIPTIKED